MVLCGSPTTSRILRLDVGGFGKLAQGMRRPPHCSISSIVDGAKVTMRVGRVDEILSELSTTLAEYGFL